MGNQVSIGRALRFLRRSGTASLYILVRGSLMDAPFNPAHPCVTALTEALRLASPRIVYLNLSNASPEVYQLFWPTILHTTTPSSPIPTVMKNITSLSFNLDNQNYTHEQVIGLLSRVPHLRTLSLNNLLKDDDYKSSTASLPHLQELQLLSCHRRILDLLIFPSQTRIKVRFPASRSNEDTVDEIIKNFLPPSFSQSTLVLFTLADVGPLSSASELYMRHEDTPTGRQSHMRLTHGRRSSYRGFLSSFQLATRVVTKLESVNTVHLDVQAIPFFGSLVQWMGGFPDLQVLELGGVQMSQVLIDLVLGGADRLPQLRRVGLKNCPEYACIQICLSSWLAARKKKQRPVELEHLTPYQKPYAAGL